LHYYRVQIAPTASAGTAIVWRSFYINHPEKHSFKETSNMNHLHKVSWITAAVLATALAAGCDRNKPSSETAGQRLDRTTERAGEKMDQAAADAKLKAGQAKDTVDDAAITAKVKTAMIAEPGLKAMKINVDTAHGVVTLTGTVETPQSLERATQVAQSVDGVKSVDNRLNLKSRA